MREHVRKPVLLFVVLAIAVGMGLTGDSLSPMSIAGTSTDVARILPTEDAAQDTDVTGTEPSQARLDPTAPRSVESAPTPSPTSERLPGNESTGEAVPTETPAPVETTRPSVPENTTGASIIVERGTSGDEVALTFDAGEGPGYTTEILDFLAARGIKASFGITGDWARQYPDLVKRMVDEGHMVFNHSDTHQSWTGASTTGVPLTEDQRIDELLNAAVAIQEAAEYDPAPFWRPPYGDYDAEGQALLAEYGYDYTLYWTCDSLAWNGTTPDEIAARCGPEAEGGGPGAIILMHVTQEADYLSLDALVGQYEAAGYRFVTMEEMIAEG